MLDLLMAAAPNVTIKYIGYTENSGCPAKGKNKLGADRDRAKDDPPEFELQFRNQFRWTLIVLRRS